MNQEMEPTERTEPRRGIAPFANGVEIERFPGYEFITSKPVQLAGLGKATVTLYRPLGDKIFDDTSGSDQAFTVDPLGNTYRGNLREFLTFGFYQVQVIIKPHKSQRGEPPQKLNIWIDGTKPFVVTTDLEIDTYDGSAVAVFLRQIDGPKNTWESFVLPNRKEILQPLRIDVGSN